MFKLEFCKSLSANDLGLTQSHQAGLLIPKRIARLPYFPILDRFSENPRESMTFYSIDLKTSIQLSYIYYNNKDRGSGTRSEYRLTGTTKLFRELKAVPAQNLEFGYIDNSVRAIIIKNEDEVEINSPNQAKRPYITTNGWKIVEQK
jgi:hypothetical protein